MVNLRCPWRYPLQAYLMYCLYQCLFVFTDMDYCHGKTPLFTLISGHPILEYITCSGRVLPAEYDRYCRPVSPTHLPFRGIIIQDIFMMNTKGRHSWINLKGWLKKARLGDYANAGYGSLPHWVLYRSWHSSTPHGSSIRKRHKTREQALTEIS